MAEWVDGLMVKLLNGWSINDHLTIKPSSNLKYLEMINEGTSYLGHHYLSSR